MDAEAMLDVLPNEMLTRVISFLPPAEAIRTSVLSSRWEHLYKGVPHVVSAIETVNRLMKEVPETIANLHVIVNEMQAHVSEEPQINYRTLTEGVRSIRTLLESMMSALVRLKECGVNVRGLQLDLSAALKIGKDAIAFISELPVPYGGGDDDEDDDDDEYDEDDEDGDANDDDDEEEEDDEGSEE